MALISVSKRLFIHTKKPHQHAFFQVISFEVFLKSCIFTYENQAKCSPHRFIQNQSIIRATRVLHAKQRKKYELDTEAVEFCIHSSKARRDRLLAFFHIHTRFLIKLCSHFYCYRLQNKRTPWNKHSPWKSWKNSHDFIKNVSRDQLQAPMEFKCFISSVRIHWIAGAWRWSTDTFFYIKLRL